MIEKTFREKMDESNAIVFDLLERQTANGFRFAERTRQATKIKDAISGVDELSHMICDDGTCGSVFCIVCRKRKQDSLYKPFRSRADRYGEDDEVREYFRYLTILHELVPVSFDNDLSEYASLGDIEKSVGIFRSELKSLDRSLKRYDLWARGTVHLELINMDMFRFSYLTGRESTKQRTLKELEAVSGKVSDLVILVHSHILFDLNGMDEKKFGRVIRGKWDQTLRQVDIRRLTKFYIDGHRFTEHKVDDALRNISAYGYNGSNGMLSFASQWGSSRKHYKYSERKDAMRGINAYVEGVKGLSSFDEKLTLGQVRFLIKAHNAFTDNGGRGLLVSIM